MNKIMTIQGMIGHVLVQPQLKIAQDSSMADLDVERESVEYAGQNEYVFSNCHQG